MSGKYVPPHLRGKVAAAPVVRRRGVHFPSNATGEESMNVRSKKAPTRFRNANLARSEKYKAMSRSLATRKLRNKPVKSLLKRGKTAKRLIKSA
jgi:hypothetical protein